jgi:hypothetical protein
MPELAAGRHLLEVLFEVGPTQVIGMGGHMGISEAELLAWQTNQGIELTAWECRTVRTLSREYASMLGQASDPKCPAPYIPKALPSIAGREKIADAMDAWADKLNAQKSR